MISTRKAIFRNLWRRLRASRKRMSCFMTSRASWLSYLYSQIAPRSRKQLLSLIFLIWIALICYPNLKLKMDWVRSSIMCIIIPLRLKNSPLMCLNWGILLFQRRRMNCWWKSWTSFMREQTIWIRNHLWACWSDLPERINMWISPIPNRSVSPLWNSFMTRKKTMKVFKKWLKTSEKVHRKKIHLHLMLTGQMILLQLEGK